MKKSVRYALRITGGVLLLLISIWLVIYIIMAFNKERFHEMAITQINKQVKGNVNIGEISAEFFRTFPGIVVRLEDVSIRDSLWNQHHHEFLKAEKLYICFKFISLLKGKPKIGRVIIEDGAIYLYTDDCGYCNLNRSEDIAFNKGNSEIPDMTFINTRMIIANETRNSYHDIEADYLDCHIIKKDNSLVLKIALNALVHGIGFNLEKGSYLKEKMMEGRFLLTYYSGNRTELNNVKLKLDKHPFIINGAILLGENPMSYDLQIETRNIHYQKAVGLLTESLDQKFDLANLIQPFDVGATLAGKMAKYVIPRITTHFNVKNTNMETPLGPMSQCTYEGNFTNQLDSLQFPGDANSKFIFTQFSGNWSAIPITSSRIEIINLLDPFLICDLHSEFSLLDLNTLSESSTIQFQGGTGKMDITYDGPVTYNDSIPPVLNGTLALSNAEFKYLPRNLLFSNGHGLLEFKNQDLLIKEFIAVAGKTNLTMSGEVINLLALVNINPEQLTMEWNISTPELDLHDFVSYAGQRVILPPKEHSTKNKMIRASENIDRMLSNGTAKINLAAGKLTYKKFVATDVAASILLEANKILLEDVKLNHAGGKINLSGTLTNGNKTNYLVLESGIFNVDIPALFHAFDNFGQDAITDKNMKGKLSAKINMTGTLTDKAEFKENSIKGIVDFNVRNGELIQFEPAIKIAATAFKKRDFTHIFFADLKNKLKIDGSAITIQKMEIRSNVIVLFVEGIYDTKKGTDMSILVPVSNLSKAENEAPENKGRAGMNIRLRAKTGEDGKLKVTWDPFNTASKRRKEESKLPTVQKARGGK